MLQSLRRLPTKYPPIIKVQNFHDDYNATREEQTFKLQDGRTMGFAEYGDLDGTPAVFCHGGPGSRYDGFGYHDIAKKHNLRIICPDRPGHGLSSIQRSRKLSEYPNDISQLAKHLGIPKYHVFGQSGGGPYAVACAYGSPKDELLNVGVIAGMGPPACVNIKDAGWYTTVALAAMKWIPTSVFRLSTNWYMGDDRRLKKSLDRMFKYLTEEDRAEVTKPGAESVILATLKAAYAQGPEGAIRDGLIYSSPWDFELSGVQKKVFLFYGRKDDRTPLVFGRYYKQHLPHAELIEFEDASHFTISKYDEEIVAKLFGPES